jgi:exodeoxyribonuclease V alpha subunit
VTVSATAGNEATPAADLEAWDHRLARGAGAGTLGVLNRAGLMGPSAIHVARRLVALAGESDESEDGPVTLAVALAVRAVEQGSVCVDLAAAHSEIAELVPEARLPERAEWLDVVLASRLVASGVLRCEFGLLYLDRYHRLETQVCADLTARAEHPPPVVAEAVLGAGLDRVFPATGYAEQRAAVERAARTWTTVLTGGPGTGKTTTVAGLLGVLLDLAKASDERLSIALCAPTGKAAARLAESVQREVGRLPAADRARLAGLPALTLHRLLGVSWDNATRFRHDRGNRLKYDVVVVDETSMVDLLMMSRLLEAMRPDARLILVGDPDQLSSVGAGAVLSDLVQGFAAREGSSPVVSLNRIHRFGAEIGALAAALRRGDADAVLTALRAGGEGVEFVETDQPDAVLRPVLLRASLAIRERALAGDAGGAMAALHEHRLICAHRDGPYGVSWWNRQVERWLSEETGLDPRAQWYAGRPLLVTRNDYTLGIYNGENGVCVRTPDGALRGLINASAGVMDFATTRLTDVETMHAMTVHKCQGSQAAEVTVLLPPVDSRLLTRELLYTAVTRAERKVRLIGSEAEVRAAVLRQAVRATGLRQRLAAADWEK